MKRKEQLLDMPLWQMTGRDLLELQKSTFQEQDTAVRSYSIEPESRYYVYGLAGIARLFGCSIPTASRIKARGLIAEATTQVGRKIIVDAPLALKLIGKKTGGR